PSQGFSRDDDAVAAELSRRHRAPGHRVEPDAAARDADAGLHLPGERPGPSARRRPDRPPADAQRRIPRGPGGGPPRPRYRERAVGTKGRPARGDLYRLSAPPPAGLAAATAIARLSKIETFALFLLGICRCSSL